MKRFAPFLIGAALVITANAATVEQTKTQSVTSTTSNFSFNQFDSSLGTLTGISLTIVSSDDSGSFTVDATTSLRVKNPTDFITLSDNQSSGGDYTGSSTALLTTPSTSGALGHAITAGNSQTYTLTGTSLISGAVVKDLSGFLATYTGAGTVTFGAKITPQLTITGGAGTQNLNSWLNSTHLTLVYTYTPASLPALRVNNVTVNEGSPYAVFTVSGVAAQQTKLSLTTGTATLTTDFGPSLQYFDGAAWQPYTADTYVSLNGSGSLLVRTPIVNDAPYEISETFTLVATNTGGAVSTGGLGTIKDDGTGDIFKNDGTTDPAPVKDDDRPLTINNVTVNEGSPYAVFTVSGAASQKTKLRLVSGTATMITDFGSGLQYFDGSVWQNYTADTYVSLNGSGKLLVRTSIVNDVPLEISEVFTLVATNTSGSDNDTSGVDKGIGTIKDDGTGVVFKSDGTVDPAAVPNDDGYLTYTALAPFKLDRQSGLYKQTMRVTSHYSHSINGFTFTVALPAGATLYNANTTTLSSASAIFYQGGFAAGATIDMVIEVLYPSLVSADITTLTDAIFSTDRILAVDLPTPTASTETIPTVTSVRLTNSDLMIEWATTVGNNYAIEYSSNLTDWIRVAPTLTANANRTQWIDNGPPKTASHPSLGGSRFYRVVLLGKP